MKKLFEFLLPICFHEYETIETLDLFLEDPVETYCGSHIAEIVNKYSSGREKYTTPIGKRYILRCKKCGNIKSKIIKYNQ